MALDLCLVDKLFSVRKQCITSPAFLHALRAYFVPIFVSFISDIKLPGANNFVLFSGDPGSPIIEMLLSLE